MAKPYIVNITNGSGSTLVPNGDYSTSVVSAGYSSESLNPSTVKVTDDVSEYSFTISATGTLTLHVTEEGTVGGTVVEGAKFIRCDSLGNTYGSEITTDSNGNAVFEHVPFASSEAPSVYYKQTATSDDHNFDDTLKSINLTVEATTSEIMNPQAVSKTFKLTDANYEGLNIDSAELTIS